MLRSPRDLFPSTCLIRQLETIASLNARFCNVTLKIHFNEDIREFAIPTRDANGMRFPQKLCDASRARCLCDDDRRTRNAY